MTDKVLRIPERPGAPGDEIAELTAQVDHIIDVLQEVVGVVPAASVDRVCEHMPKTHALLVDAPAGGGA